MTRPVRKQWRGQTSAWQLGNRRPAPNLNGENLKQEGTEKTEVDKCHRFSGKPTCHRRSQSAATRLSQRDAARTRSRDGRATIEAVAAACRPTLKLLILRRCCSPGNASHANASTCCPARVEGITPVNRRNSLAGRSWRHCFLASSWRRLCGMRRAHGFDLGDSGRASGVQPLAANFARALVICKASVWRC